MTKRFLNVEYSVYKTRINVTEMEDLSEIRRAIKTELGEAIPVAAALIQLYTTNRDQLITDLDDITPEKTPQYYQKLTQGGSCVVISTLNPPTRESSKNETSEFTSVPDKLRQLGVKFSIRDINYLINNETAKYSLLKSPQLTPHEARTILTFAESKIKSATRNVIGNQHSFFLDGSLNVGKGQAKSSLYYAFSESGVVYVAKVYNGNKESFLREVETNQVLEHKNLVKFVKTFSIQNEARHVIIMPLFPRSVADWLIQDSALPLTAVKMIARSCFDALCHLHSKKFCFADLKPANIMLHNSEPSYATLVDYGATVQINSPIIEFTESYCLDAGKYKATEHLDWICLGTTLAQIGGFDIFNFEYAADLVNEVYLSTIDDNLKKLIVSCLQSPSSSGIESALKQLE